MKIGYFYSTGLFQLPSAVERPVKAAVEKLATAGHELVAFPTPFAAEMLGLWYIFGTGCGLHNLRKTVDEGGEGWDVAVEPFVDWGVGDGYLGKKVAAWAAAGWGPEDEVVKRVREYEKPGISVAELQKYVGERDKIRQVYNDTWTRMGLDAVVCPGFGVPAVGWEGLDVERD